MSSQLRQPIGFLDDDSQKRGVRIANLPVFGTCDRLLEVVRDHDVAEVIIAMPNASGKKIRRCWLCEKAGVPAKTLRSVCHPQWKGPRKPTPEC